MVDRGSAPFTPSSLGNDPESSEALPSPPLHATSRNGDPDPNRGLPRRIALTAMACSSIAALACPAAVLAESRLPAGRTPRRRNILLTGGRHDINIGDQAHTPGMLRLIQSHLPGVEVTLWPVPSRYGPDTPPDHAGRQRPLRPDLAELLRRSFPDLNIIAPAWAYEAGHAAARAELAAAMGRADLLVSGSGGGIKSVLRPWVEQTGKPWGAYGVTMSRALPWQAEASFLFCRDTPSVDALKSAGLEGPAIAFGPDATFAMDLRDETRAGAFLERHGLEDRRFLCVIPRLRYSPYPEIYGYGPSSEERERAEINERHKEGDHAAVRELIVAWVRQTGMKVLACPEMTYGVPLSKEQWVDPLPEDVRPHVVWRDTFWLCDEAVSVFARALAMVSLDCHSPILALVAGTPAIHLRLPTDNPFKSRMFADIGLPEWIAENEGMSGERLTRLVMEIADDHDDAVRKVQRAMDLVRERQRDTMGVIRDLLWA